MLEGALIGAVVGIVAFIIRSIAGGNAASLMKQAFAARKTGGTAAARAVIDSKLKAQYGQRYAAFTLIEDRESLERELPTLDPIKHGYSRAIALLGLISLGDTTRVAELAAFAPQFEQNAPRMWGRIKKAVNGLATIGRVLGGAPSTELDKLKPDEAAMLEPWCKTLVCELIGLGLRARRPDRPRIEHPHAHPAPGRGTSGLTRGRFTVRKHAPRIFTHLAEDVLPCVNPGTVPCRNVYGQVPKITRAWLTKGKTSSER